MKNQRLHGLSLPVACAVGVLISLVVILIGNLIFAICISNEYFELTHLQFIAIFLQFIGTFIGALIAGSIAEEKKMLISMITGICNLFVQICIALLFFDGISVQFVSGLIVVVVAVLCSIYFLKKGKRRSASRKKRNQRR